MFISSGILFKSVDLGIDHVAIKATAVSSGNDKCGLCCGLCVLSRVMSAVFPQRIDEGQSKYAPRRRSERRRDGFVPFKRHPTTMTILTAISILERGRGTVVSMVGAKAKGD